MRVPLRRASAAMTTASRILSEFTSHYAERPAAPPKLSAPPRGSATALCTSTAAASGGVPNRSTGRQIEMMDAMLQLNPVDAVRVVATRSSQNSRVCLDCLTPRRRMAVRNTHQQRTWPRGRAAGNRVPRRRPRPTVLDRRPVCVVRLVASPKRQRIHSRRAVRPAADAALNKDSSKMMSTRSYSPFPFILFAPRCRCGDPSSRSVTCSPPLLRWRDRRSCRGWNRCRVPSAATRERSGLPRLRWMR